MFTTSFRREIYKWSQKVKLRVLNRKRAFNSSRKPSEKGDPEEFVWTPHTHSVVCTSLRMSHSQRSWCLSIHTRQHALFGTQFVSRLKWKPVIPIVHSVVTAFPFLNCIPSSSSSRDCRRRQARPWNVFCCLPTPRGHLMAIQHVWHTFIYCIVAGLFTLNFKREFLRCCRCFKPKWRDTNVSVPTRAKLVTTERRSFYSRTTNSSFRASTTSSGGLKLKKDKVPCGEKVIRFPVRKPTQENSPKRNGYDGKRDDRHNVNNFLVVHMKGHSCDVGRLKCWPDYKSKGDLIYV